MIIKFDIGLDIFNQGFTINLTPRQIYLWNFKNAVILYKDIGLNFKYNECISYDIIVQAINRLLRNNFNLEKRTNYKELTDKKLEQFLTLAVKDVSLLFSRDYNESSNYDGLIVQSAFVKFLEFILMTGNNVMYNTEIISIIEIEKKDFLAKVNMIIH